VGAELDCILGDNRSIQKYAVADSFQRRRLMPRVAIAGDRPYCGCLGCDMTTTIEVRCRPAIESPVKRAAGVGQGAWR
jgi:hypothetical protein